MSGLVNKMKFNEIKKKLEKQAQTNNSFSNEHEQEWKQGKTYKFRLLFPDLQDAPGSSGPYFEKWTHGSRNADDKYKIITCPTTFYNKSGFDKCPTCKINNDLWNSEVDADKILYRKFQRKFSGYALAYVVSDPVNEDAVGTVKVLRLGIKIYNKLKALTLGETIGKKDEEIDPDLYIGFEAFSFESDGVDLIIEVSQNKSNPKWNDYELSFARKAYAIDVDTDRLMTLIEPIKFGEDIKEESDAQLQKFYDECVLGQVDTDRLAKDEPSQSDLDKDLQEATSNLSETATTKPTPKTEIKEELSSETETNIDDEVAALLGDVNKEVNEESIEDEDESNVDDLLSSIEAEINA